MTKRELKKFANEHEGLKDAIVTVVNNEGGIEFGALKLKGTIDEIVEAVNDRIENACAEFDIAEYAELLITANDGAHISDGWDEVWLELPYIC